MSSVVIAGNTSGTVTLSAPDIAGTTVLTLPATSGTFATEAYAQNAGFASGTRLGFQQTAAPTGWTKDTTAAIDDSILRLVTGSASSGGSTAFSTFNGQTAVGATTLSLSQIPSHTHTYNGGNNFNNVSTGLGGTTIIAAGTGIATGSAGTGGSHNHSITTSIKYYDFIIASKD